MMKYFPIMIDRTSISKAHPLKIQWYIAELAYSAYCSKHGTNQSLERIAQRGGFYASEMNELLPNWLEQCKSASLYLGVLTAVVNDMSDKLDEISENNQISSDNVIAWKEMIEVVLKRAAIA